MQAIARAVSQTASAVTVAVAIYAQPLPKPAPGPTLAGSGRGLGAVRLEVDLAEPLGTRSLIDAHDGVARVVLDPADVLKRSYLPTTPADKQPGPLDLRKARPASITARAAR